MYWLVESKDQLERLRNSGYKEAYVDVVGVDIQAHPAENKPCLVYIRPLEGTKGYVISLNHTEAINVTFNEVTSIVAQFEKVYTADLKRMLYYFSIHNFLSCCVPPRVYDVHKTKTHKIYKARFPKVKNLNRIIPIVKHYESLEQDYENLRSSLTITNLKYANFYKRASLVYYGIEQSKFGINTELFFNYFYRRDNPWVYTQYNLNTSTTRPSNKFGGVNYAALNKKTGERKSFVPQNDYFVELDVKAYHPVIVSHLINYKFETDDVHESFAKMYEVDREKAKEITFQQFYGSIFAKYKQLSYFKLLHGKQVELFDMYQNQGFLEEPISGYRFEKNILGDIKKEKLFNYYLQATESSYNVEIIENIQKLLQGLQTKLVLTVYDSFLFDVKDKEKNILNNIKEVFDKKRLNTSIKSGYDYNFK